MTEQFPQRLRKIRKRRRIGQEALSERCGLSRKMIGKYERAERIPNINTLKTICDELDVSADYIIGRKKYF